MVPYHGGTLYGQPQEKRPNHLQHRWEDYQTGNSSNEKIDYIVYLLQVEDLSLQLIRFQKVKHERNFTFDVSFSSDAEKQYK